MNGRAALEEKPREEPGARAEIGDDGRRAEAARLGEDREESVGIGRTRLDVVVDAAGKAAELLAHGHMVFVLMKAIASSAIARCLATFG